MYDEGGKITEERLMLKSSTDFLGNQSIYYAPSTPPGARVLWLTHPEINTGSQNNMLAILDKYLDYNIW